jgi:hypothetical protein
VSERSTFNRVVLGSIPSGSKHFFIFTADCLTGAKLARKKTPQAALRRCLDFCTTSYSCAWIFPTRRHSLVVEPRSHESIVQVRFLVAPIFLLRETVAGSQVVTRVPSAMTLGHDHTNKNAPLPVRSAKLSLFRPS